MQLKVFECAAPKNSPAPAEWKWGSREAGKGLNLLERQVEEGKGLDIERTKQEGVGGGGKAGVLKQFYSHYFTSSVLMGK